MTRLPLRTVLASALIAAGCAPPSWEECEHGLTWAQCPGASSTSAPVLACRDAFASDCYWFTGGLVPQGFSPWSAERSSCRYRADRSIAVARDSYLDVSVAIAPTSPGEPSLSCSGTIDASLASFCADPRGVFRTVLGAPIRGTAHGASQFAGPDLTFEVIPVAGGLRGRVCRAELSDLGPSCDATAARVCATSGTITIDAYPPATTEGFPIDVHATFEDGLVVDAHL